jgi:hypothetical protein
MIITIKNSGEITHQTEKIKQEDLGEYTRTLTKMLVTPPESKESEELNIILSILENWEG